MSLSWLKQKLQLLKNRTGINNFRSVVSQSINSLLAQLLSTPSFFHIFSTISELSNCVHILLQHEKCIQMSTNKPMIGPVVLEIACDIFVKETFSFRFEYVVCVKNTTLKQLLLPWKINDPREIPRTSTDYHRLMNYFIVSLELLQPFQQERVD